MDDRLKKKTISWRLLVVLLLALAAIGFAALWIRARHDRVRPGFDAKTALGPSLTDRNPQPPAHNGSAATNTKRSKPSPSIPVASPATAPVISAGPAAPVQSATALPALALPSQTAFHARHKHGFGGGCEGELRFDGDHLTFTSREHPLSLTRGQVQGLDGEGIKDGRGKNWHFEIRGLTPGQVRALFARWLKAASSG